MNRISTLIIFLLFSLFGFAQMLIWQKGESIATYAISEIDSVIFVKANSTTETLRTEPTEGGLPMQFTVSEGSTVFFSQGNLRYQASTSEWAFAPSQISRVGEGNSSIAFDYSGWIDLFGWGTSGYNEIMPYTSNMNYTQYALVENIAGTNYDWGVYNKISNGGNQPGLWRTLTADEWLYLFYSRHNASSLFGFANIAGTNGLIILPDAWQQPEGVDFVPSTTLGLLPEGKYFWNMSGDNYEHNVYTQSQWEQLQSAGAVFLPAAGYRKGTELVDFNEYGAYWTSSGREDNFAYRTLFYSTILSPGGSNISYFYGYSVRLVQDATRTTQPQGEMHVYKSNAQQDKYPVNQVDSITYK